MPISNISNGLSNEEYDSSVYSSRGEKLEELLTIVCNTLGEVGSLTENKADVSFLLSIVGSYLIGLKNKSLDIDTVPPNVLFNTNLFPLLDNYTDRREEIPADE
jgi:hypothetical protein